MKLSVPVLKGPKHFDLTNFYMMNMLSLIYSFNMLSIADVHSLCFWRISRQPVHKTEIINCR